MYKLPENFNGDFLLEKTLEYITFGENNLVFSFDNNVAITVESSLQHQVDAYDKLGVIQSIPLSNSRLMQLIGRIVVHVQGDEEGTLAITFDNGHILKIFDDRPNYESYNIHDGDHTIYV